MYKTAVYTHVNGGISKTSKIIKKGHYPLSHYLNVNVLFSRTYSYRKANKKYFRL